MNNFIKGYCFTNLDGYENKHFPKIFCAVPRIGERIESNDEFNNRSLRVCMVTHKMKTIRYEDRNMNVVDIEPYIIVELTK